MGLIKYREYNGIVGGINAGSPTEITFPDNQGWANEGVFWLKDAGAYLSKADIIAKYPKVMLSIGGDDYTTFKSEDIFMLEEYRGDGFVTGALPIVFSDHTLDSLDEEVSTAFVPSLYDKPKLSLEIDASATNPTFMYEFDTEGLGEGGRREVAANPSRAARMVVKHHRDTVDILNQGDEPTKFEYTGGGRRLKAFHFKGSHITRIRVLVNEQEVYDWKELVRLNRKLTRRGYVPQTDYWHIDFVTLARTINGAFSPIYAGTDQKLEFEIYTSTKTEVPYLVEKYDMPNVVAPTTTK